MTTILIKGSKLQLVDHGSNRVRIDRKWFSLRVPADDYVKISVDECGFRIYGTTRVLTGVTMKDIVG